MPNTYTQIYIQTVFTVQNKLSLIELEWQEELYKYITGIITNEGQKLLAINGMQDHIHILIGLKPTVALSNVVRDIKANSSKFINEQRFIAGKFEWQQGFGAFSYSHSQIPVIAKYIENQEEHHKRQSFREEYLGFLKLFNVDYKEEFVFEEI